MQNMSSRYKLTNVPGQTHSPHFDVFFAAFVYEVPSCQSVPRLKRIKVIRLQRSGIDTIKYHT